MVHLVIDGFKNLWNQELTQFFPFPVYLLVASPGKVDPFKGAGFPFLLLPDTINGDLPILFHHQRMPRRQLLDAIKVHVHGCLNRRAF